jgi:hypothetical protein
MSPTELLKTVYLGDRSCKGIFIEGWRGQVSLQVDVISRINSPSETWDFNTEGDITDGRLVFTGVTSICFEPSGPIPNDLINEIRVDNRPDSYSGKKAFTFLISVGSVDEAGTSTEVIIQVQAEGLHLEDPANPGQAIRS